jgi:hypothetical protein
MLDYRDKELEERRAAHEIQVEMCIAIMFRTVRDLINNRSGGMANTVFRESYEWVFCYDEADDETPNTFSWVCSILGLPHEVAARVIHRGLTDQQSFEELKERLQALPRNRGAGNGGSSGDQHD